MIWLPVVLVVVLLVLFVVRRLGERRRSRVRVSEDGVSVRGRRFNAAMAWKDVRQIDVARYPSGIVEFFSVELHGAGDDTLAVYDDYAGFAEFQAAMFARWPQIAQEWTRVFTGPPTKREITTVWRRGEG